MYLASKAAIVVAAIAAGALSGACSSGDSAPSGSSTSDVASSESSDGGLKKNAEQGCTKNEDCESGVCFVGGNQAFCTVKCTAATQTTVCVAPFTGTCNKQGFCKRD